MHQLSTTETDSSPSRFFVCAEKAREAASPEGAVQARACIYTLSDPATGEVRYVGKTVSLESRLQSHIKDLRRSHRAHWIKSLKDKGLTPKIEIVEEVAVSDWPESERFWIEQFKQWGFKLTNTHAGGEGGDSFSGRKHTPETIAKMKLARSKRKFTMSEAGKAAVAQANKNRKWSKESREKVSKASKEMFAREGFIEQHSARLRKPKSESWRKNYQASEKVAANKAKLAALMKTPEMREKLSNGLKNKWRNDKEWRNKMIPILTRKEASCSA